MRAQASRRFKCAILFGVALGLSITGCKFWGSSDEDSSTITIRLAHSPELRSYLGSLKEQFEVTGTKLQNGRTIKIELISEPGLIAAQKIASGDLKTEAWVAPSSSLIDYTNGRLTNLGPRQDECFQLFATPIVAAIQAAQKNLFNSTEQTFSWTELVGDPADKSATSQIKVRISHGLPKNSAGGLSSLLLLANLSQSSKEMNLDLDKLKAPHSISTLKGYQLLVSGYSPLDSYLLERLSESEGPEPRMVLTTEQQLASYNQKHTGNVKPLIALYPREGSVWQDHNLCISAADWVTPAHRAALKVWTSFLSSESAQLAAHQEGFRPAINKFTNVPPLTEQFGVNLAQPSQSFIAAPGSAVAYLVDRWGELSKPGATLIALDSSGSMEGAAIDNARDQLRKLVSSLTATDLKAFMTFSTNNSLQTEFNPDPRSIFSELDKTKALGGSTVYDGLKQAYELITAETTTGFRRNIIFVTDGGDKNSNLSFDRLLEYIAERSIRFEVNLVIVAIHTEPADFSELKRLAKSARGIVLEGGPSDIQSLFEQASASL